MPYICRVCGAVTETAQSMCTHLLGSTTRFEDHVYWIESKGVNYLDALNIGKGHGKDGPFLAVIEQECKTNKQLRLMP